LSFILAVQLWSTSEQILSKSTAFFFVNRRLKIRQLIFSC